MVSPEWNGAATIWLQRSTAPRRLTRQAAQSSVVSASAPSLIRLCSNGNHLLLVQVAVELIAALSLSMPGVLADAQRVAQWLGPSVLAGSQFASAGAKFTIVCDSHADTRHREYLFVEC